MAAPPLSHGHRPFFILRVIRAWPRLAISLGLGLLVGLAAPWHWRPATRFLIGWDAAAALYLVLVVALMTRPGIDHMRRNAALQDEGRFAIWDFAYFSFVIGMTAQTADVSIASREIRRTATAHGIVSFFFNVTLLALMVESRRVRFERYSAAVRPAPPWPKRRSI
jgi:uncharacterized membrane protein